jgi:ABC-2 type transport system permease protein
MKSTLWRSFKTAAWLGWQIESNWADPFLFFIYSVLKPVTGAAIIVVMYSVVTKAAFDSPIFAYMFIGNAFFQYVAAVMTGVSWSILDDREHYKTLKYIYTAPVNIPFYLLGRGIARFLTATFAVVVIMIFGIVFLKIPFHFLTVNWGLLFAALVVGVLMLAMMGLILAGLTLLIVRQNFFLGDVVASTMFIFCGVIFPMNQLPRGLDKVGYFLPISYWLELIRRAFIGKVSEAFPTFVNLSNLQLFLIMLGLSIVFGALGFWIFKLCDHRARERGLIDWSTSY